MKIFSKYSKSFSFAICSILFAVCIYLVPDAKAGTSSSSLSGPASPAPDIIVQYQTTSGNGGTVYTSGAWSDVPYSTVVRNNNSLGSLASSAVTVPAGTYLITANSNPFQSSTTYTSCRIRLYNNTSAAAISGEGINGTTGYSATDNDRQSAYTSVTTVVTFSVSTAVKAQVFCPVASIAGYQASSGAAEIYSQIQFNKVS